MSVGSKTDLNFWISWNTVRGRDCAGSNFRSGSTWRSGELFSKGKDRKMPGAGADTPLVPVEELQNLLKFAMEKADQPVTMLCHNGKEESLIAVYDARLYKEITDFLESGRSSVYRFLNTVGYSLYHTSVPENYFQNINDPEIYKKVCTESNEGYFQNINDSDTYLKTEGYLVNC